VRLATYPAGDKVSVTVLRGGKRVQLEATLEEVIRPFLGVSFDEAAASGKGAVITEAIKGFPAEKAGLKKDDIVTEYNGNPIKSAEDLRRLIQQGKPNGPFKLKVMRDGKELEFSGKLGER